MKQSAWGESRIILFGVIVLGVMLSSIGCEWDSAGEGGTWNSSMGWANFSGLYRRPNSVELVDEFSSSSNIDTTTTTSTTTGTDVPETRVIGQSGGTQTGPLRVLTGTMPFSGGSIKPGSVTINLMSSNGAQGQFEDNGSSVLSGTFAQVAPAAPLSGTGTVDYDTGTWSISFSSLYLGNATITYSYVLLGSGASASGDDDSGTDGDGGLSIAGGTVASVQVEQTGNQLTFRLSNGYTLTGQLSMVTIPNGDQTGRSAGDVSATYEVSGDINGSSVKISGTLSGVYVPPADIEYANDTAAVLYGILSNRILQGIWMQSGGTADVYGAAPQQSVPVNVGDFVDPVVDENDTNNNNNN